MIQNLTIKNFKAHKSIEMKELANVNILLGKNNSGKTAILEALFLLAIPYGPVSTLNSLNSLNNLRGYITGGESGEKWDSLFYNWIRSRDISIQIEAEETPASNITGELLFSVGPELQGDLDNNIVSDTLKQGFANKMITLSRNATTLVEDADSRWQINDGQKVYIIRKEGNQLNIYRGEIRRTMSIQPLIVRKRPDSSSGIGIIEASDFVGITQGLRFNFKLTNVAPFGYDITDLTSDYIAFDHKREGTVVFISARNITDPEKEAIRFSQLEIENRHNEVVDILKIIEPNLKRLFVGANKKGNIILYGDIGIDRPMPLPLMGDGMIHALSIALSMVNSQNGLVLIDEIENGLHYSVLTNVWKMIFQTSQKLNVQVFVATHSDECIKAAYEAVESLKCYDSLKLYRFDKMKDRTRVVDYTAKELYTAITSEQEVR